MHRNEILGTIARELSDDFTVAVNPDLFEGPDVLAGRSGDLVAVFVPKQAERQNLKRLRARLGLSRLALPKHTRCVLAYTEGMLERAPKLSSAHQDFHQIVSIESPANLRATLTDRPENINMKEIPAQARALVWERADFLFMLSCRYLQGSAAGEKRHIKLSAQQVDSFALSLKYSHPDLWSLEQRLPRSLGDVELKDSVVIIREKNATPRPLSNLLKPYVAANFWLNFNMDGGIPYLITWSASVLITGGTSASSLDPLKPFGAAALAGLTIIPETEASAVQSTVDIVSSWLRKAAGE